jgi:flagellar protein FlbD
MAHPRMDKPMIVVTRLNGPKFAVNPDLLQRVEATPDTILTLIDGTKYIVEESLEQVIQLVVQYRARVVAATVELTGQVQGEVAAVTELRQAPHSPPPLRSVPEVD